MTDGGGLPSLVLRMTLLLLLGFASLQLQAWMSRRAFTEKAIASEDVLRKTTRSARNVKHESIVAGEAAGRGIPGRVQCRDGSLKNGSDTEMDGRRLVRDRPCLVSEKETVSFATLFVVPEADAVETFSSEQIEVKERTRGKRIEKDKLDAVLQSFLESIQVSMPGTTEVTIITNQNKEKRELPQNAVWKPSTREFARGNLMVQRLESYIVRHLEDWWSNKIGLKIYWFSSSCCIIFRVFITS
ncbi:hypothetical protein M758_N010600 [Ceratodon purpureus]|nr:hypothetical protein M758_N010600 [Ceratodon purpureus]